MTVQECAIEGWHPPQVANGPQTNRYKRAKQRKAVEIMVWAAAKQANWKFVPGRVRLDVVFVYSRPYRTDVDNLYARCKGVFDGLKGFFFTDDSMALLDAHVSVEIEKGRKALILRLSPAEAPDG